MKIIILLLITLFLNSYLYANNIATVTALTGQADIERKNALLKITLGSKLEEQDKIFTKENSKLQLIFKDETVVSIGKNSKFSIEEYLFEDNKQPLAKLSLIKGAIRTVTGKIGKIAPKRFSISTPTATIGIRGTSFFVFVENDGSSSAFCSSGAISVQIAGVIHIVNKGFYISISPQGKAIVNEFSSQTLKSKKENYFTLKKAKKSKLVDFGSLEDSLLDLSLDDSMGLLIDDISNATQGAAQNSVNNIDNGVVGAYP